MGLLLLLREARRSEEDPTPDDERGEEEIEEEFKPAPFRAPSNAHGDVLSHHQFSHLVAKNIAQKMNPLLRFPVRPNRFEHAVYPSQLSSSGGPSWPGRTRNRWHSMAGAHARMHASLPATSPCAWSLV